ncbi:hypothetical protein [Raoultibacter timonensis]|uniref:hypothetical protein n=1 Tax=Raoultibacter timonensis TaxID=1907662 RepID=UPI0026DAA4ED|nr:hypothetical protein [Raoultibacter timonensis]
MKQKCSGKIVVEVEAVTDDAMAKIEDLKALIEDVSTCAETMLAESAMDVFAMRVARGDATSEELAFMKELVARRSTVVPIDGRDFSRVAKRRS